MSGIISSIGSFVLEAIEWIELFIGSIFTQFQDAENPGVTNWDYDPVLFIFVIALPLVGLGIGLLSRLIKTRG